MANSKFIRIPTAERLPEYGTWIVINYKGEKLLSRFNKITDEELFKQDYEFWLCEVPDTEEELKETLKSILDLIDKSTKEFEKAKNKITEFQKRIENGKMEI